MVAAVCKEQSLVLRDGFQLLLVLSSSKELQTGQES